MKDDRESEVKKAESRAVFEKQQDETKGVSWSDSQCLQAGEG